MKTIRTLTIFAATLCVGCVPFPHTVVRLPAISGRLVASGTPVVGAQILAAQGPIDAPCLSTSQLATTDAFGVFKIEKKAQLNFLYAPLVAPISIASLSLCISFEGATVFADQVMWKPYDAEDIILECDLASRQAATDTKGRTRILVCQATMDSH